MSTHNTLCHGGWGNEVPRRRWRMKRYAVPMRHRAGTASASPRQCRIVDRLRCMLSLAAPRPLCSFLRGERRAKQAPLPTKGKSSPHHQRCQTHVQPGFKTKPDSSFVTDANLLASMELEHRPCEAVLAGDSSMTPLNTLCHGGVGGTKYRAAGGG